jgi:hypothetical protein
MFQSKSLVAARLLEMLVADAEMVGTAWSHVLNLAPQGVSICAVEADERERSFPRPDSGRRSEQRLAFAHVPRRADPTIERECEPELLVGLRTPPFRHELLRCAQAVERLV